MSDYEKLVGRLVGLLGTWEGEYQRVLKSPANGEVGYGRRVARAASLIDSMSDVTDVLDSAEKDRLDRWERDGLISRAEVSRTYRLTEDYTAEDVAVDSQDGQEGYKPFDVIGPKGTLVVETGYGSDRNEVEVTGFVADPFVVAYVQRRHVVVV